MSDPQNNTQSYKEYLVKALRNINRTRKVEFEHSGDYAKIQCFNPKHKGGQERKPSFRLNLVAHGRFRAGSGKCHTCGHFAGGFKQVLEGIRRPDLIIDDSSLDTDEFITVRHNDKIESKLIGDDVVFQKTKDSLPWPAHQIWRSINGQLVHKIGGRLYFDEELETQMLYLPCMVNGTEVGGVRANIEKRGKANYFNTAGSWTKTTGLFPYDYVAAMLEEYDLDTLILGEGPRDGLNPIQKNIPALAILGSENWSEVKAELVLSLPIKHVILAFDPDEAGERAKRKVYKSLKNEIDVRKFDLSKYAAEKESIDLGNMPDAVAVRLKTLSERISHV